MSSDISCEVTIDGVTVADTASAYYQGQPVALSGLSVTWGRASAVEQPDTASLSCKLVHTGPDKGHPMFPWVAVGKTIQVISGSSLPSTGDPVDVAVDGSFEGDLTERVTQTAGDAGTHFIEAGNPRTGAQSLRMYFTTYDAWAPPYTPRIGVAPFDTDWTGIPPFLAGVGQWGIRFWLRQYNPHYPRAVQWLPIWLAGSDEPDAWGIASGAGSRVDIDAAAWQEVSAAVWAPPTVPRPAWIGITVWPVGGLWTWAVANPVLTWDDIDPALTWHLVDCVEVDDLQFLAPPTARVTSLVFSGRITDLQLEASGAVGGGCELTITASDPSADIANDEIGDNPWPAQGIVARINHLIYIMGAAAGQPDPFIYYYPPGASFNYVVTAVDVDKQAAWAILQDLANSADLVLWPAFDIIDGFLLWFEDSMSRAAVGSLVFNGTEVVIEYGDVFTESGQRPGDPITLSACDISVDVAFSQSVADLVTRVDATWQEQTTPDPTERYVHRKDTVLEPIHGKRRVSLTTQLTTAADCQKVADRVLARSNDLNWIASGLRWDTNHPQAWNADDTLYATRALDGQTRCGLPVAITDLPEWAPKPDSGESSGSGYYLEGGTYTYEGGRWIFDMNLSPSQTMAQSVRWKEADAAWQWQQFDDAIAWSDLWGVGGVPDATWERLTANIVDRVM